MIKYAKILVSACSLLCVLSSASAIAEQTPDKPNVVIFYVDDLGWGDLSSYGAHRVQTPHVDKLAKNGIRFTDAHSSSATCTPSRYSLLTGEHGFRRNAQILKGDAPLLIGTEQATLPKMLKKAGYMNAVVGKWHLGLGDGKQAVDWNGKVKPGPLEIGFDYSFLIPATGDRVPTVYLENHQVVNLTPDDPLSVNYKQKIGNRPTGYENPELLKQGADRQHDKSIINGISRIGWMKGGKSAEWRDEDFPFVTTEKANQFISQHQKQPFFLFFSFHDIHVPRVPHKMFQGSTEMGVRGDAIVQMDWITGQVVNHLESLNLLDNTLIIFTSDNGAVMFDGYHDEAFSKQGSHKQNGPFKGGKYSAYEAGTRVPFIVHYPAKVEPGISSALMSQMDIYASIAVLLGQPLAKTEAIDSQDHLSALFNATSLGREFLIAETPHTRALRYQDWKYIRPTAKKKPSLETLKKIASGVQKTPQLYNLSADISESVNLANELPQKVQFLERKMRQIEQQTERYK
ncbi:sulfatase family protein [Gayadomonas joobiniege]|uniref:sulfatase family protein n=1 Tax=Gayadomonas joobiniege TaxID=1234606 RepID=UPI00047467F1|nr:arylsulfatase [Gayadomonas joobiniege]